MLRVSDSTICIGVARGGGGESAGGLSPPPCGQLTRCFSAVAELLVILLATQSTVMPQYVIRPSVCLSVTFTYVFHTGWNTSKIISRLISLRFWLGLQAATNIRTSAIWSNRNTPKLGWNGGGVRSAALSDSCGFC